MFYVCYCKSTQQSFWAIVKQWMLPWGCYLSPPPRYTAQKCGAEIWSTLKTHSFHCTTLPVFICSNDEVSVVEFSEMQETRLISQSFYKLLTAIISFSGKKQPGVRALIHNMNSLFSMSSLCTNSLCTNLKVVLIVIPLSWFFITLLFRISSWQNLGLLHFLYMLCMQNV